MLIDNKIKVLGDSNDVDVLVKNDEFNEKDEENELQTPVRNRALRVIAAFNTNSSNIDSNSVDGISASSIITADEDYDIETNTIDINYSRYLNVDLIKSSVKSGYDYISSNFKPTFKSIRLMISVVLFTVSIFLFLLTIFQDRDIFQQVLRVFVDAIQITNSENGRPL